MDTSNFKEVFTSDEVKQLRQRVTELEKERDEWEANSCQWEREYYKVSKERDALKRQRDELVNAGSAVVERWDSPLWKDLPHTGEYIHRLREAIASVKEK